jgi:hypothetical protein
LNRIYNAIASYMRVKIHLYNIRTGTPAIFLQDFLEMIQPILARDTVGSKSESSSIAIPVLIDVPTLPKAFAIDSGTSAHEEDTSGQRYVIHSRLILRAVGYPLGCRICLLHNLLDYLTQLSSKLEKQAVSSEHGYERSSFPEFLDHISDQNRWGSALRDLCTFDEQMSSVYSRRPSETQDIWERYHNSAGSSSTLQLEDVYGALPSLRTLALLHCDIIHLPHYQLLVQGDLRTESERWVPTATPWFFLTEPESFSGRPRFHGLPGGAGGIGAPFHWKPCTHAKYQRTS